ncbi:tryptophan-rich sensory protein [Candidatus Woesearchaeota archaeon]|nr:tryptophan-rich sensory protein [Candidatus Woesearchaeota archaeon]
MKKAYKLIISLIIPFLAAAIGSIFTAQTLSTWYATLQRPSFSPPSWIFSPVWSILFLLMGFSLYLVWKKGIKTKTAATFFGIQLGLNALWSVIFFGLQQPLWAFVEIIFLWAAILGTIITFYKIDRRAAYLLIPYLLWVSFAAILNYYIYILNI